MMNVRNINFEISELLNAEVEAPVRNLVGEISELIYNAKEEKENN